MRAEIYLDSECHSLKDGVVRNFKKAFGSIGWTNSLRMKCRGSIEGTQHLVGAAPTMYSRSCLRNPGLKGLWSNDCGSIEAACLFCSKSLMKFLIPCACRARKSMSNCALNWPAVLDARGALSMGKAAEMARLSSWAFEDLLARRKIVRNYGDEDLQHDIEWSRAQSKVPPE
jgi:hypothetical protein